MTDETLEPPIASVSPVIVVATTRALPTSAAVGPQPLPPMPRVEPSSAASRSSPSNLDPITRLRAAVAWTLPHAYYQLVRVGPAGLGGVAALVAAAIIGFTALASVRNATEALTAQIAHAQQRPSVEESTEEGLGRVVAGLPTREQIPAVVGQVLQQARDAGVALDKGQYMYSPPKAGGVGRYELEFPVKAEYPNVRNFIDRTLTAVPSAGLDKLHIERKVVGDVVVSADVHFVVFVRSE